MHNKPTKIFHGGYTYRKQFVDFLHDEYPNLYHHYCEIGKNMITFTNTVGASHIDEYKELVIHIKKNEHLHDFWLL